MILTAWICHFHDESSLNSIVCHCTSWRSSRSRRDLCHWKVCCCFFVRIFAHSMKRVQSKFSQKGLSLCGYVTICLGLPLLFENMLKIQLDVSQIGHICVPANWQTDCGLRIVGGLCEVLLCGVFCNWNLPHACESGHAAAHGNPGRCDRAAASCRPGPSASPRWCPWVAPVER